MPAIMSVAFSSISGRFKKRAKCRQALKLKTRSMSSSQLDSFFAPLLHLEEQGKIPRNNDNIDNQTIHSMQTAIKHLQIKLTFMRTTIKDQGDKMKFLESQVNKNG